MRIYIAGPMSHRINHNFDEFNRAEDILMNYGYEVCNPASFGYVPGLSREECLRRDIPYLLECDAVVVIGNWQLSWGASMMEVPIALQLGIPVYTLDEIRSGKAEIAPEPSKAF